jgi:hypothetical protein
LKLANKDPRCKNLNDKPIFENSILKTQPSMPLSLARIGVIYSKRMGPKY